MERAPQGYMRIAWLALILVILHIMWPGLHGKAKPLFGKELPEA